MSFSDTIRRTMKALRARSGRHTDIYNHRGYRIQVGDCTQSRGPEMDFRVLCPEGKILLETKSYGACQDFIAKYHLSQAPRGGHAVIFIHRENGLDADFSALARECEAEGFTSYTFRYSGRWTPFETVVRSLHHVIQHLKLEERFTSISLVGQGYGGLVATEVLNLFGDDDWNAGAVVVIGTPLAGSAYANRLRSLGVLDLLMGKASRQLEAGVSPAARSAERIYSLYSYIEPGADDAAHGATPPDTDGRVRIDETCTPTVRLSHHGCLGPVPFHRAPQSATCTSMVMGALLHHTQEGLTGAQNDKTSAHEGHLRAA